MTHLQNRIPARWLTFFVLLPLSACTQPSSESTSVTTANLCPEGPCPRPGPKEDPPPPAPTWFYPAANWWIVDASELNTMRGVQWWANAWDGNVLHVKGYYPQDFGTGITVGSEPAHVFLTFNVISPTEWRATSKLLLPTYSPWGGFYISQQVASVQTYMNDDGVVQQLINQNIADCIGDVCTTHENFGIYQDDGSGATFVYGTEDTIRASAVQAIVGFLGDFTSNGGVLLPPGSSFEVPCNDEECSNSPIWKYLSRQAQALTDGPSDNCRIASIGMGMCAISMFASVFFLPLLPWAGGVCGGALLAAAPCINEQIGGRSSRGACAVNIGPTTVTGPDGRVAIVNSQTVDRQNCDL